MLDELLTLAWHRGQDALLARRRAEAVVARVGSIALLFAILTVAWIPVDAAVFGAPLWQKLAAVRACAAVALFALARACHVGAPTRTQAALRLEALFAIPAVFFFASIAILREAPREGLAEGVAAAYSFMPFMLAVGIAAFPLTLLESLLLASVAFLAQAWALQSGSRPLLALDALDSLWLLFLVAAVAGFAAVSQLKLLRALVEQAVRDPLTGCLRRESGRELLDAQFLLAARKGAPLAVLFADIDRFKSVNDDYGHDVGDRVLAQVATSLRTALRESDVLVRWGGEEFLIVLPDAEGAQAVALIERLRAQGFGRLPSGRAVTLSIGVAEYRRDVRRDSASLVALADERMYLAKQAGRNRFVASDAGDAAPILPAPA
jgi:diguanylate cyclase (GGDEF)-like protein